LPALTFFSNLKGMYGAHYINNAILVDTRMPSLQSLTGNVTVIGCDRLCPARYTFVGTRADDPSCSDALVDVYLHMEGDIQANDLALLGSAVQVMCANLTNYQVCVILYLFVWVDFAVPKYLQIYFTTITLDIFSGMEASHRM